MSSERTTHHNPYRESWEHKSQESKQLALAGSTSREEYLQNRISKAQWFREIFELDGSSDVFEIGSGEGITARELSTGCRSVTCCDVSRTFLSGARETCAERQNVRFRLIESDYLDFLPSDSFRFGYSMNVFIHFNLYDIYHYLGDVSRVLEPGGYFYFDASTIGPQTLELFRYFAQEYRMDPEPIRGYMNWNGEQIIRSIVREVGLEFDEQLSENCEGLLKIVVRKPVSERRQQVENE